MRPLINRQQSEDKDMASSHHIEHIKNNSSGNDKQNTKMQFVADKAMAALEEDSSDISSSEYSSGGGNYQSSLPSRKLPAPQTNTKQPANQKQQPQKQNISYAQISRSSTLQSNNPLCGRTLLQQKMANAKGKGLGLSLLGSPTGRNVNRMSMKASPVRNTSNRMMAQKGTVTTMQHRHINNNTASQSLMVNNHSEIKPELDSSQVKKKARYNTMGSGVVDLTADSSDEEEEQQSKTRVENDNKQGKTPETVQSTKAPQAAAEPNDGLTSCSLNGILSCTLRDGKKCHIISGYWEYENTPGSIPQRFELLRDYTASDNNMNLTTNGDFDGSVAYLLKDKKKKTEQHFSIKESVNFSFKEENRESTTLFNITGSGNNKLGKFNIDGTAIQRTATGQNSYTIQLTKKYTEMIPISQLSPWKKSKKRNLSKMNEGEQKQAKVVLDVTREVPKLKGHEKVAPLLLLQTDQYSNEEETTGLWKEFGCLGGKTRSVVKCRPLTYNIRNVSPRYRQMCLDFFESVNVVNVQDLLDANEDHICSCLLKFNGFMAACAMEVWKRKVVHKDRTCSFHNIYRPEFAKRSVLSWKEAAKKWLKQVSNGELAQDDNDDEHISLKSILGQKVASKLSNHCNIRTVQQLLDTDGEELINKLVEDVGEDFPGRKESEIKLITEGLIYGWFCQVQEAMQDDEESSAMSSSAAETGEDEFDIQSSVKTPMSYVDLMFLTSRKISDEEIANADPTLLAPLYRSYLSKNDHRRMNKAESIEVITKLRQSARLFLGLDNQEVDNGVVLSRGTRVVRDAMHLFHNICKTVPDDNNKGFPKRTIFAYDFTSHVIYEFMVTVKQSLCSSDAGNGAFLTFKGAKSLKKSSEWKKKKRIEPTETRQPLEATFSISGATVHLKGSNIHDDEHHYGPDSQDRIGLYREFTLDDFEDVDNVTFSSKHEGCALIELESRYAPVLLSDRKTDLIFSVKDFVFGHEPSSWRFDVEELINGHPQVVDFTDDTTGTPHEAAKANLSMYVNEVGHNPQLVENVKIHDQTSRSVTYFINIDKPMEKRDTVELLVNYKGKYEEIRERRGYGEANLFDGVKSDDDDVTRVQRNLKERFLTEESILSFNEDEIRQVVEFLTEKVFVGVKAATESFVTRSKDDESTLVRQYIARRRLDWMTNILRLRFYQLLGNEVDSVMGYSDTNEFTFFVGMWIFVNDWPKNSQRAPYTGLGTILSIKKDEYTRDVFEVTTLDGKYIEEVPFGVVTIPTESDFVNVSDRCYQTWKKQQLPHVRAKVLKGLDSLIWDRSFVWNMCNRADFGQQAKILNSLRWEFIEELLFLLMSNERLSHPFDEEQWCPLSVNLMTSCLHSIADCLLLSTEKNVVFQRLLGFARDAANSLSDFVNKNTNQASIDKLALVEEDASESDRVVVVESVEVNRASIDDYMKGHILDKEWYILHQIVLVVHPIASLIDWDSADGTLYSIEKLCETIGLDKETPYISYYKAKTREWKPLL